jgi:hypothetical protein
VRSGAGGAFRPFDYTDAARFWGADDPKLALLLHAVVGGTPAYRREFVAFDTPSGLADFDAWVIRTVVNPQSPLFREARYLLAEETEAKWGEVMGGYHVQQLARARDLLSASYDTSDCVLACYSAAGFHDDLRTARDPRLALITLDDIYA